MLIDDEDTVVMEVCPTGQSLGCGCRFCATPAEERPRRSTGPQPSAQYLERLFEVGDKRRPVR